MVDRDLYAGLIRLHVLHHATQEPIFGQGIMDELAHHGYRLSPGTLYPMLARMERHGWLRSSAPQRATAARHYRLTPAGLLSEDSDLKTGELWGNYPQTYSLVGLINCAGLLSEPWSSVR